MFVAIPPGKNARVVDVTRRLVLKVEMRLESVRNHAGFIVFFVFFLDRGFGGDIECGRHLEKREGEERKWGGKERRMMKVWELT